MSSPARLLMIGLDAGDQDFIRANLSHLPNIAPFFREADVRSLRAEPLSGAVWASFVTGLHPQEHGYYHHLQWNPERMQIQSTHPSWIGELTPFWRTLATRGVRTTAFDVPFVFPGPGNAALEIANWGSHDLVGPFWCNDDEVRRFIRSDHGLHPMKFEVPVEKTRRQLAQMRDDMIKGAGVKARLIGDLMRCRPWDIFITVFGETHRAGHLLWPHDDEAHSAPSGAILDVYRAVDSAIGHAIAAAGPECDVVLFALHGMGRNSSQSHLSRAMLRCVLGQSPAAEASEGGLIRGLRRSVPMPIQHAIAELVPRQVRNFVVSRDIVGAGQWRRTPAFSLEGDLGGYWRLNVVGRERKGMLTPDAAASLRAKLTKELLAFTTIDGRPLAHQISSPANESGARAHLLPDLLAEWDASLEPVEAACHPVFGSLRGRLGTGRGGNHRFNGFYAHRGPRAGAGPRPDHICELGRLAEALAG